MKNKKILLFAYTNLNFGDDMFIYTICKAFPNQKFDLYAPNLYNRVFENVPNLTVKRKPLYKRVYTKMMEKIPSIGALNINTLGYDAVVYVIGGLFDEDEIWKNEVKKYGLIKMKNRTWGYLYNPKTPFFLLGCNLTRVKTLQYINEMKTLFDGLADICFRDKYSYGFFNDLKNVRYAPDIVLNYNCNDKKDKKGVLISIWGPLTCVNQFPQWKWAEKLWDGYENFIIEITKKFIDMGEHVTYLALCKNEGDLEACNRISRDGGISVDTVMYDGNINEIVELFESSSFVVGTRFHSVIMAINAQCAIYPIVYESKTKQLLMDSNYDGAYSDIENEKSYLMEAVLKNYWEKKTIQRDELKQKAGAQFDKLKLFVEG